MVDPLVLSYMTDKLVHSSYNKGNICLNESRGFAGGCVPTMVGFFGAEVRMPANAYDTIIMANTIEHCQNAMAILQNIWISLKPGGHLVFGEEFSSSAAGTDFCHPLRITFKFYHMWLTQNFGEAGIKLFVACRQNVGRTELCSGAPRGPAYEAAVQLTAYAVAQKPPSHRFRSHSWHLAGVG